MSLGLLFDFPFLVAPWAAAIVLAVGMVAIAIKGRRALWATAGILLVVATTAQFIAPQRIEIFGSQSGLFLHPLSFGVAAVVNAAVLSTRARSVRLPLRVFALVVVDAVIVAAATQQIVYARAAI